MKYSLLASLALAASALAAPFVKRSDATEAAPWGYATMNGGTTGGAGGTTVSVSTLEDLQEAAAADGASVITITQALSGDDIVNVASNKTIVGASSDVVLTGIGIRIKDVSNVIVRNVGIKEVLAETGDAIGIQAASNVWIDHCDLSSNQDHDKDYYDGLLDITHGVDYVTVSYTYLHDHWKASLVGHSDSNEDEDSGHLTVTYGYNYFQNLNSRGPSYRFGTGHIFNNYYESVNDGINARDGCQLLVENNVWSGGKKALYSTDSGYAVATGNDFGNLTNEAETGTLSSMDYDYTLVEASSVKSSVVGSAGQTLTF